MKYSNYLNYLLDKPLNAKLMVTTLTILLKSDTVTEMSIKQLIDCLIKSGEDHNYEDYNEFNRLRYDFVDLTNRRIYEFDGDQHFDKNNHFHETYDKYIDAVDRDLIKQRIAKQLKFDIVRVSGVLNVIDFISILKRSNLEKGQSLFIRDTYYEVIKSSLLKESSDVDLLEEITNLKLDIKRLNDENNQLKKEQDELKKERDELKKERDELTEISISHHEKRSNNVVPVDKTTLLKDFLNENSSKFDGIQKISTKCLYELFDLWLKSRNVKQKTRRSSFIRSISDLMSSIGYTQSVKKIRFNKLSNNVSSMVKYMSSICSIDDEYWRSHYFEKQQDYITQDEVDEKLKDFVSNNIDKSSLSDRDLIIYEYLRSKHQLT